MVEVGADPHLTESFSPVTDCDVERVYPTEHATLCAYCKLVSVTEYDDPVVGPL